MSNKVHYLNFYADTEAADSLACFPSAFPKIEYVCDSLIEAGFDVINISACQYKKGEKTIQPKKLRRNLYCRYLRNSVVLQKIDRHLPILYSWLQIFLYILFQVKRDDTLLVYHSMFYLDVIQLALKIKRVRLIYEVEELFYSLSPENAHFKEKELSALKKADAYLLVNDLIKEKISIKDKPFVISYSAYKLPENRTLQPRAWDDKIHVVYAGCIEQQRKAAFMAVEAALSLSPKYVIHILGFGAENDIDALKERICSINNNSQNARAVYEGSKFGQEYSDFLSHCQIGLSCHTYDDTIPESADCTFPSKVFVYLLHGLSVVSFPLRCLSESEVACLVSFSSTTNAESLAEAIKKCGIPNREQTVSLINMMHASFVQSLNKIIHGKK